MNMYLEFKSRPSYLEWKAQWVVDYAEISREIRETKVQIADHDRHLKPCSTLWYDLRQLQAEARQMLLWRGEMKVQAQQQWLAARLQPVSCGV